MRLRLLIDVEWADSDIPRLAEAIADQSVALVSLRDGFPIGGRLMGATLVDGGAAAGSQTEERGRDERYQALGRQAQA
jgi:hypothetical protein